MKKLYLMFAVMACGFFISGAGAYQVLSSKELGRDEARNQNVVVKCTTDAGKISNHTCTMRRYAKCTGTGTNKKCDGWLPWKELRTPGVEHSEWRSAAVACCKAKGLR